MEEVVLVNKQIIIRFTTVVHNLATFPGQITSQKEIKNKNKNKNKFISEQKMKFDDNEILLINILLETHTMGTTAIT